MAEPGPPLTIRRLIKLYLVIASIGAVIAVPILALFGWYGFEFTKQNWPGNWPGWAAYGAFSAAVVLGPVVGWRLFKLNKPYWALASGAVGFLLAPLTVVGAILGNGV